MARKKKKTNWEELETQSTNESNQYRDVYESQQMERSDLKKAQTPTSRILASVAAGLAVGLMVYLIISLFDSIMYQLTANGWIVSTPDVTVVEDTNGGSGSLSFPIYYWTTQTEYDPMTGETVQYQMADDSGDIHSMDGRNGVGDLYDSFEEVPYPDWYNELMAEHYGDNWQAAISVNVDGTITITNESEVEMSEEAELAAETEANAWNDPTSFVYYLRPNFWKIFWALLAGFAMFAILYAILMRNLQAQNMMSDTSDINQWKNDQHIALPEEIQRKYDWFPDVGAHSSVQVSALLSHMMLSNKGLKNVQMAERAKTDIVDSDGDIVLYKNEIVSDDAGNPKLKKYPMIDEQFGEDLFTASGLPKDKELRKRYDATQIPYNKNGENRDKMKYDTVADLINADWDLPVYEPQRPAGAYIVDTEPVNTMVLAITRAGKGQTYIEPLLDMWLREKKPNNIICNDPKGELLVKHYVRATVRGFQIIQFNLINAMKTDIYNPLGLAAESAREGDFTKVASYVENIADVFFPNESGEDPVWPNAANNAFKRAAYGLIDYYLEEEQELRDKADKINMDDKVLDTRIDKLWGRVTLYNTYEIFVQLTSKQHRNAALRFNDALQDGKLDRIPVEIQNRWRDIATWEKDTLYENKQTIDDLTLFFNATAQLPQNQMRTLVENANNAIKSMANAEKMMASVYGIAITALSFFTDPTISTLTSGTLSQNVDLGGLSFPRRFGVRFNADFVQKYHLIGAQVKWDAFSDPDFTQNLGKDFYHQDLLSREGWAKYYFKGVFETETAYIRLRILNAQTGMLIRTFYFKYTKEYQRSLDSRYYITDPVLGDKIVKNGLLTELVPKKDANGKVTSYVKGKTTFKQQKIDPLTKGAHKHEERVPVVTGTMVRYSEKPKMVFLVTPPHLAKYAKLILILLKQQTDLNFEASYMTKENQKPLYKTRFMLDELGNLQSDGHGISNFQTMLSIGLGQDQQFTLILQTLQQLRDVYGESADKIIQGNTSDIIFLKSTDDAMLDTLQKMSGTTHKAYIDSKTVTRDMQRLFMQNEGKASFTMATKEVPVISYNDMAFISERNSIVFRAGDSPIWNRNATILPMSWRLFQNTIEQPGTDYSLQTIPTLSSAMDFDVRKNQPDFEKMLYKRMHQAVLAQYCMEQYKKAYNYSDYDIEQLDPDLYAKDIMEMVNRMMSEEWMNPDAVMAKYSGESSEDSYDTYDEDDDYDTTSHYSSESSFAKAADENREVKTEMAKREEQQAQNDEAKYACGLLSKNNICPGANGGNPNRQYDDIFINAFARTQGSLFSDKRYFTQTGDGSLAGKDGTIYIRRLPVSQEYQDLNNAINSGDASNYTGENINQSDVEKIGAWEVEDEFYRFLVSLPNWKNLANGDFEYAVRDELEARENQNLA